MAEPEDELGSRDRILLRLKTRGPQTATQLAQRLEVTPVAARQHLALLEEEGLVDYSEERRPVGRPARRWSLTEAGSARFPEGYADLTVDLLHSMREAFGDKGLAKLIDTRTERTRAQYEERLRSAKTLAARVRGLARLRTAEGYMAEVVRNPDGSYTLIENHCPICAAAKLCQGLCKSELELFRTVLGPAHRVEREEHIVDGSRRCTYRIEKETKSS